MSARPNGRAFQGGAPQANGLTQSYLAGIGASGALVASAVVGFMLLLGVVSFNVWPRASERPTGAAVELSLPESAPAGSPGAAAGLLASTGPLDFSPAAELDLSGGLTPGEAPAPAGEPATPPAGDDQGSGGGITETPSEDTPPGDDGGSGKVSRDDDPRHGGSRGRPGDNHHGNGHGHGRGGDDSDDQVTEDDDETPSERPRRGRRNREDAAPQGSGGGASGQSTGSRGAGRPTGAGRGRGSR